MFSKYGIEFKLDSQYFFGRKTIENLTMDQMVVIQSSFKWKFYKMLGVLCTFRSAFHFDNEGKNFKLEYQNFDKYIEPGILFKIALEINF
jgi:hypothetical protein